MFFSPLEQFSILKIVPIKLGIIDISFTNSSLLAVLSFVLIFLFYNFACDKAKLVPGSWQYITESLYEFVFFTHFDMCLCIMTYFYEFPYTHIYIYI